MLLKEIFLFLCLASFSSYVRCQYFRQATFIPKFRSKAEALIARADYWGMNFVGLVERHVGYAAEEHIITTSDKYILKVHRIAGSPNNPPAVGKKIVFLQHGYLQSSDNWVRLNDNCSLAFELADAGYDVWLGNFRGNTYGVSHEKLSPFDPKFWEFGLHEHGTEDLAAIIDCILNRTKEKSLIFIGYSFGSLASYILLSEKPEYNDKIRLIISLAPFTQPNAEKIMEMSVNLYETLFHNGITFRIPPPTVESVKLSQMLCNSFTVSMCSSIFTDGNPSEQASLADTLYRLRWEPAGGSVKTLRHYQQFFKSGCFRQYDYSDEGRNIACYGTKTPPEYNLLNVTKPVIMICGKNDPRSAGKDVQELVESLPNLVGVETIADNDFYNIDFYSSKHGKYAYHSRILELLRIFFSD